MIQTKNIDCYKTTFLILAITFSILWLKSCSTESQTPQLVDVTVPAVQAKLETKKPVQEPVKLPKNDNSKIVKVENPIDKQLIAENERLQQYVAENEKLKLAFAQERDSLKKQLLFEKVVQLNNFSTDYEDDNLKLHLKGVVQGEVKEITPSYKIKERTAQAEVKAKETVLRLLAGGGFGINKDLNQATWKLNIGIQNRKGNVIRASYQKIGNQDFLLGEYDFSIFNFKR